MKAQATLADSQSLGSFPVSMDIWKIWASAGAISFASVFRTMLGILSGPVALFVCNLWSSLATPLIDMFMCSIVGVLEGSVGAGFGDLGVNTDLNWLSRQSALPWLSLISFPLTLRGEIPRFSCFLALIKRQKGFELFLARPSWMVVFINFHSALRSSRLQNFWKLL